MWSDPYNRYREEYRKEMEEFNEREMLSRVLAAIICHRGSGSREASVEANVKLAFEYVEATKKERKRREELEQEEQQRKRDLFYLRQQIDELQREVKYRKERQEELSTLQQKLAAKEAAIKELTSNE